MKRRGFTIWEAIAILCVLGIIAVILFPFFARSREPEHSPSSYCRSNLKQISLGIFQYTQDYDDKFPLAKNSRLGLGKPVSWIGALQPYLKSTALFQCPSDENVGPLYKSSYAFSGRFDEVNSNNLEKPVSTVMNFEVQSDADNWTQTGIGPQAVSANKRHEDGANYSFADGHARWLKPEQVTTDKPDGKNYTFAIK